ncbi:undecaprenyl-phosphate alpha-N-acetylglucosaminyl 1-phosphate transferase [Enterovibrio norvegicus]|nr:undecaprenyl-phosphate alpha-N-acetylglucosaminyl 1-phosphate transferase [Enterovibrio norvegicus]PMI34904.1 undecaprenyl-phosphate alpha-N-acetylglucosaminyl 1-phosphate transferase [Enterovibrio norvegicus]PMN45113.1 undecaprenyl-phosphate alpha-N-acetylglucosaminyl 1-phosphate transferase [Enterovibrio norvegicus]
MVTLFFMRKVAKAINLVDRPNGRKHHDGAIPLVGGISICLSLLYFLFNNPTIIPHSGAFATCITLLVILGALDDKFDISFKVRFLVQALVSIAMMHVAHIELTTLGNMFGFGEVILGSIGYPITILAVIGAINAFNMVDGIDGLLGGLASVTFGALAILMINDNQSKLAYVCFVVIATLVPYILLNLGVFGRKFKVFMGDAGSMLIGFTVIWLLLLSSQNGSNPPLRPVTALWLIALPLMDMSAIMIRRIRRGDSPFKPDREHLHHIFQRLGLTGHQTLAAICLLSSAMAGFGIWGEMSSVSEVVMFTLFLLTFACYASALAYIWRVTAYLKRRFSNDLDKLH